MEAANEYDVNFVLNSTFTESEILKALHKLKLGKSPGIDGILNEMLKYGSSSILTPLCSLFNVILRSGTFPNAWKKAFLVPVFKSGDTSDPSNYRGISINSCLAKLFTSVLNRRLINFLDSNGILSPFQSGFRAKRRTADNLFVLRSAIDKHVYAKSQSSCSQNQKYLYCCFVDFQKAFDRVWRTGLLWKLQKYGINGNFYNLVKSMYNNTKYCVKSNNCFTEEFDSKIGVKQGCNLSPTLFNIFINDLPSVFGSSEDCPIKLGSLLINCLMYADDLLLTSESKTGLQSCLDKLCSFCSDWKLSINIKKTKVMVFNKSNHLIKGVTLTYNGVTLELVREYCYLGFVITPNGKFKGNFRNLKLKAMKALFSLRKGLQNGSLSVKVALSLFDSLIVPIMTYGCEIWGHELNDKCNFLNDVSISFYRFILGVSKHAPCDGVVGELGRYPIQFIVIQHMLKYWHRLVLSDDILLKSAYTSSRLNSDWSNYIHRILNSYSGTDVRTSICNINSTVCHVYENLCEIYEQTWLKNMHNDTRKCGIQKNKLRTYRLFKTSFKFESYLLDIRSFSCRKWLTKLRISDHNLQIELGRRSIPKVPANERFCKHCKSLVEDEFHFIIECPKYITQREILFSSTSLYNPGFLDLNEREKFMYIFTHKDKLPLVKFISSTIVSPPAATTQL